MHGVAALLAVAALAHLGARALGLPVVPFLILGGLALASLAPPEAGVLSDALVLGVAFLLFTAGLELDPRRVKDQTRTAVRVGAGQFAIMGALGYGTARALGMDGIESVWVALALTASSTLLGVRALQRERRMFDPFGRLVIGALLLQDVLLLLAIPVVAELGEGWRAGGAALAGLVGLGAMAWAARRWLAPRMEGLARDEEAVLLVALTTLFAFTGAASALDLPVVVGAFLAGVALSSFPTSGMVRPEVAPIADFFAAVFFTALGAIIRVPTAAEAVHAVALAALVMGVTPPLVAWIAEGRGVHARPALEAGTLLAQTSELSLVIALYGAARGDVSESVFMTVALVTLVTMLLTPVLTSGTVVWALLRLHPGRHRPPLSPPPPGHVLLLGAGATGLPLLGALSAAGRTVTVVEDDPVVLRRLARSGITVVRGDASDPAVLAAARIDRAGVVVSTLGRVRANAAALAAPRRPTVLVRVFEDEEAAWVEAAGGVPVSYAEAAADAFSDWFDRSREGLEARREERSVPT